MKLLSFGPKGSERPGLLMDGDWVLDLSQAMPQGPASMRDLLSKGFLDEIKGIRDPDQSMVHSLSKIRVGAPVPDPTKILCLGLNYRDHAEEQSRPLPKRPLVFPKLPSAVIGPNENIVLPNPELENFVDPEAELAVVIGKKSYQVSEEDAMDAVAGYTIMNDVSGRDTQNRERQWLRAKGFDTFAPMGPWLVTKDEAPDPHDLEIICLVNNEVRQHSHTSNLIFRIPYLVSYLSQTITLMPGDLISTGTPGGVGIFRDPPVRLLPNDEVEIKISCLGTLKNRVVIEKGKK